MGKKILSKFQVTDLDAVLLATPFKIQTNWYVITGAACTGKTTQLEMLADRGYLTAAETARQYFKEEMAKGRSSQEIRDCGHKTQLGIFHLQQDLECKLPTRELVFLDRGMPDLLSFHRVHGLDPNEVLPGCRHYRYAGVFILDRLPIERKVQLGPEDKKSSKFLDQWLERDYTSMGYSVVRVPVLTPRERLAFILDRVPVSERVKNTPQ